MSDASCDDIKQKAIALHARAINKWSQMQKNLNLWNTRLRERMGNPQIGDLVVEVSKKNSDVCKQVGVLLSIEVEDIPGPTDMNPENHPKAQKYVYHIECLDGTSHFWCHCKFVALVDNEADLETQPAESISGCLTEKAQELYDRGMQFWSRQFTPEVYNSKLRQRVLNPELGDLVIGQYTRYAGFKAVGKLIGLGPEQYKYDPSEWDEAVEGRPAPSRLVYVIECLDGSLMAWENCEFFALIAETPELLEKAK